MHEITEEKDNNAFDGAAQAVVIISTSEVPKGDPPGIHPSAEFISSKVAAAWMGLPLRSFLQYVQMGALPSYKIGKHRLFRRSELLKAIGATRRATWDEILR